MVISKTRQDLKPVLMEPTEKGLAVPYYIIADKEQVIFVVAGGLNGGEFNKTAGFISSFPGMQTYWCLSGSGILLMQRNDELGEAKEFKVVTLNPFKQATMPAGWAGCLVNTAGGFLVVLRSSAWDDRYMVTKPIIEKKGLAYYVVEKKGEISLEPNPNYQMHPQITTE